MWIKCAAALAILIALAWLCLLAYLRGMRYGVRMTVAAAYKQAGLLDGGVPDIRLEYVDEIAGEVLGAQNGRRKYGPDYQAWRLRSKLPDNPTVRALWDDEDYRKGTGGD